MATYETIVEEIKSRCNIVDVIGRVVTLRKAGVNHKGLCPFHREKTPSFTVSEQKQHFICFGCGKSGDVITFVMDYYNLSFREALEKLAAEYGIPFEITYGGEKKNKEEYYEINRAAAQFFRSQFERPGNPAYEYMQRREIDDRTLRSFGIGYAPDSWDSLYSHLVGQLGFEEEKVAELGLIRRSDKDTGSGSRYYDKFRNRVIFPIINTRGKVIGFGGRVLGDGIPKYLNSDESCVFYKKDNLYGLNRSGDHIRKEDRIVLVEGYMDVISLYQRGIRNVSASLGTALTERQARLISRYTRNVILSYDVDDAGQKATLRGLEVLRSQGLKPRVLKVAGGKDPDEFIKSQGANAYLALMDSAMSYGEYRLSRLREAHSLDTIEDRAEFISEAVPVLRSLTPGEADLYIKKLAADTGISEGAIRVEYQGDKGAGRQHRNIRRGPFQDSQQQPELRMIEKLALRALLDSADHWQQVSQYRDMFRSPQAMNIYGAMADQYVSDGEFDLGRLCEALEPQDAAELRRIRDTIPMGDSGAAVVADCIRTHKIETLQQMADTILARMSLGSEAENGEKLAEMTAEYTELLKQIRLLQKK